MKERRTLKSANYRSFQNEYFGQMYLWLPALKQRKQIYRYLRAASLAAFHAQQNLFRFDS